MGQERAMRLVVSEPQPGRVLKEVDPDSTLYTTFTFKPQGQGQTLVTICTQWEQSSGPAGLLEKWVQRPIMRKIYRPELRRLQAVLGTHKDGSEITGEGGPA